jgi:dTDP-4-dehydrorhamnose 3,5-epimerase
MNVIETSIPSVLILEPRVFSDDRGQFLETWSRQRYHDAGITEDFVQDNVSYSTKDTLRGLHYQNPNAQAKIVQVFDGLIYDVAVDIRLNSPTFGKYVSTILSKDNHRQLYIPPGFAHGFCVLSDYAVFAYKCSDYYDKPSEGSVLWNDPFLAIDWPLSKPLLSDKDSQALPLKDIDQNSLPHYEDTNG